MQARDMIAQYGEYAATIAKEKMFDYMQQQDTHAAGVWMAIVQEIQHILRTSSGMN
jgi:hypothetical protein